MKGRWPPIKIVATSAQAIGEPIDITLNMWEVWGAGILGVLAGALHRERRR